MEVGDDCQLLKQTTDLAAQEVYFSEVYKKHFRQTEAYILKNNGTKEEARDIFQELMLILLAKTKDPDFKLTSSLGTYLFAITRNLWRDKLKDKQKTHSVDLFDEIPEDLQDENETSLEKKLQSWIFKITEHCQRLIASLFYLKEPMEKLAVRMGWKNRHTADNQKYKCIQQLKKVREKDKK